MRYELVIRPEAEKDLSETFNWYEGKRYGLGHDFLLQVNAGFKFLERDPLIFTEGYKGVRSYLIKRFPYKILYRVEPQRVIILAVVYGGRNPAWIKKRLENN